MAELGGGVLRAVADEVFDVLRLNSHRPTDLGASCRESFVLSEESGVRLGLLFVAVRPISKVARVELIAEGIRGTTSEEAHYWYIECAGGPAAQRAAQRALRVLLEGG